MPHPVGWGPGLVPARLKALRCGVFKSPGPDDPPDRILHRDPAGFHLRSSDRITDIKSGAPVIEPR